MIASRAARRYRSATADDPAAAARLRPGDARLCDDASAQPRGRPDLARRRWNGCCGWVIGDLDEPCPAQTLLYGSFLVHYALALWALWQRRTLAAAAAPSSARSCSASRSRSCSSAMSSAPGSPTAFFHTDIGYYTYLLWVYFVRAPEHGYLQMAGRWSSPGARDDRPAFLAAGAALVRAAAAGRRWSSRCWSRCCRCSA